MELDITVIEWCWGLHHVKLKRTITGFGSKGVYHLQAVEGEFVFKHVVSTVEQELRRQLSLLDWLHAHGFHHAPKLCRCKNKARRQCYQVNHSIQCGRGVKYAQ